MRHFIIDILKKQQTIICFRTGIKMFKASRWEIIQKKKDQEPLYPRGYTSKTEY